ncbi:hypothetical protein DYH09_19805 [bacterium CPR1]|nr:hypothetical protein [bacterium CPR1]
MKVTASVLALSMLGFCAGPPPQPTLTVYDDFVRAEQAGVTTHGELVEGVLVRLGMQPGEIGRAQVSLVSGPETLEHGLDAYIRNRFLTPMKATAEQLQDQSAGVVSQSQGASDSRVVDALFGRHEWRGALEGELGLTAGADEETFLQALADRVSQVRRTDPQIQAARSELLAAGQEASESGVARFVSAGNNGELSRTLERLGVEVDPSFYRNWLADPHTTVVGASEDGGVVAPLASPDAGAWLAADGVNVPLVIDGRLEEHSGSSYATPQVARVGHQGWLAGVPSTELGERLAESAEPVPGGEPWVGAGILSEEGFWNRVR